MRLVIPVLVGLALILSGCPGSPEKDPGVQVGVLEGNVAQPATQYNLLSSFTTALPCAGQPLVWSIREESTGWNISIDGSISQAGVWISPSCGSAYLGQQIHIDAKCTATGQTATATIATIPEQVSGLVIAYAVVTNVGQAACLAPHPNAPYVTAGGSVAFYAQITTTCGQIVSPTPPSSWPAACSQ